MNDIFWNSLPGSATGEIFTPEGIGPFPAIIIFDTGLKESTKTYATFYAKKMKERGFSVFIVKLNLSKKNEIGSVIEFILKRNEVNSDKIYLIEIEKISYSKIKKSCLISQTTLVSQARIRNTKN